LLVKISHAARRPIMSPANQQPIASAGTEVISKV
ncbi:MAG: hypothetical protein K0R68_3877, partial [Mycobacterium sp.]|nr:hypothetical protein [Mycobacterium sp.]